MLDWIAVNKNDILVLLVEIHADEAAYKIHQKTPEPESLVNKVAGHTGKEGLKSRGGTQDPGRCGGTLGWDPRVRPLGEALGCGPRVGP